MMNKYLICSKLYHGGYNYIGGEIMDEKKRSEYTSVLATNLAMLRKGINLTQGQLAELIGVGRSTIAAIECKKTMTWNMFLAILMVFEQHDRTRNIINVIGIDLDGVQNFLAGSRG